MFHLYVFRIVLPLLPAVFCHSVVTIVVMYSWLQLALVRPKIHLVGELTFPLVPVFFCLLRKHVRYFN